MYKKIYILLLLFTFTSCDVYKERLSWVGKEPPLKAVENPAQKVNFIEWPVSPKNNSEEKLPSNSIWSHDSKTFFQDTRARNVGDILTVKIEIEDKAELDNKTERTRKSEEDAGAPKLFGLETKLFGILPGNIADRTKLLDITGASKSNGEGSIERKEKIETEIAAAVTQVLANGNMVIFGSQSIRVNNEVRELTIEGVIRQGDIGSDNTIAGNRIAEARVSYGGKGLITDVQQPRIGNQLVDVLSPF